MAKQTKILMVDDDGDVLHINRKYFEKKGYDVKTAAAAAEALALLPAFDADCILLDVMMPGQDGFSLLEEMRKTSSAPILFLTGRVDEESKIKGLLLGADDYIVKPYSLAELEARIIANIRRREVFGSGSSNILRFPPLEIDITAHQAFCDGASLNLSNREYDLLFLLASNEDKLLTFEDIAVKLWGRYQKDDRAAVMVSLSRLRKKLTAPIDITDMVETVWSKGYRFVYTHRR